MSAALPLYPLEQVWGEFWVSLASLLRSYTAVHGLSGDRQATVMVTGERILARHGDHWLDLHRVGATVNWLSEDGRSGAAEFTESGRLRGVADHEEEMDMAAEAWARELMR